MTDAEMLPLNVIMGGIVQQAGEAALYIHHMNV
jgi:hypothetical protein